MKKLTEMWDGGDGKWAGETGERDETSGRDGTVETREFKWGLGGSWER
jgi:hypothetical protein